MSHRDVRYRLVWCALLIVAALSLMYIRIVLAQNAAARKVGITIEQTEASVFISDVDPYLPGDKGGLRPGDRLVRMNGTELLSTNDYDPIAETFDPGRSIIFQVQRDQRTLELRVRPGTSVDWLPLGLELLVSLGFLAVAILTLGRPERDVRGRLLCLFSAAVALELALPIGQVGAPFLSTVIESAYWLLNGIQIALELHMISLLPRRPRWLERRPWLVLVLYVLGIGTGVLMTLTSLGELRSWTYMLWTMSQAELFWSFVLLPLWAVTVTVFLGYQVRNADEALGRYQAGLVLAGNLPWAIYIVATATVAAVGGYYPSWADLVQAPALLCLPVAFFVAMFRYNLIDLELVVRRSMVYTLLSGALLLVFSVSVAVGSVLLPRLLVGHETPMIAVATAALVLGLLFTPLKATVDRFIHRRLFPERRAQRQRLVSLAGELAAFGKVPLMGRHLVRELGEIFSTEWATLLVGEPHSKTLMTVASTVVNPDRDFSHSFLFDSEDPGVQLLAKARQPMPARQLAAVSTSLAQRLQVFRAELVVPVTSQGEVVGLLLLGPRQDESPYLSEAIELLSMLGHHVGTVFENARLFESATVDGLTGLLRREAILELFEHELARALRYGRPMTAAMADLDHFKRANDHHGHLVGDTILKRVAQALVSNTRTNDSVGRYGGEEFLLLMPETDLDGGRALAEKIRLAIRDISIQLENGQTLGVTVSIGLASLDDLPNARVATPTTLIKFADRNLLQAKRDGRDRVEPGAH